MSIDSYFNKDASVRRATKTQDGRGGWTHNWATVGVVPGALETLSESEQLADGQRRTRSTHRYYCEAGSDVLDTDRLQIDDQNFKVTAVIDPMGMGRHLEIELELYSEVAAI